MPQKKLLTRNTTGKSENSLPETESIRAKSFHDTSQTRPPKERGDKQ